MKYSVIPIVLLFTQLTFSQVPVDSSFTIERDFRKTGKLFPEASVYTFTDSSSFSVSTVTYKQQPRSLYIDIFQPAVPEAKPVTVVMVHGGGWRSGSRQMEHQIAATLASRGITAVTIEYRLSPEKAYPAALIDIQDAFVFLRRDAQRFGIDSSRIAFYGCSSGGHLAALSACIINSSPVNFRSGATVKAVIDIDGVLDLTDPAESSKDTIPEKPSAAKQWLGYSYAARPEIWQRASPINVINKHSPKMLFINSSIPRFHAGRDSVISLLKAQGITSEVYTVENTPHTFWLYSPWAPLVIDRIVQFLKML